MKRVVFLIGLILGLLALSTVSAILTVNLGSRREEVSIPNLSGMEIVSAIEALDRLELNLKISGRDHDASLPPGAIISHHPPAGSLIRKGRSVEAVISLGPRQVSVPDLQGDFHLRSQSQLLENSLAIGPISRIPSRRWARDTVIAQWPAPGTVVEKKAPVSLLLSDGPPATLYVMPDFIGRTLSHAVRLVQEAALELGDVTYREYAGVKPGTVISQEPALGTPVRQGDRIRLVVAGSESEKETEKSRYSLLSFYVPQGFRPREVKVVIEAGTSTYTALEESRPPGDRVQVLVGVDGKTKALIFIDGTLHDTRFF